MSHVIRALVTCPPNCPEIITDLSAFCTVPMGFCHNDLKHNIELLGPVFPSTMYQCARFTASLRGSEGQHVPGTWETHSNC